MLTTPTGRSATKESQPAIYSPATSRPTVRPARRQTMNQIVSRSHVRQNVGNPRSFPHVLANVATDQTNKKSPMSL